ncbi:MAG: GDYXXLXY domain-containing protein [Nocardioides sp.]
MKKRLALAVIVQLALVAIGVAPQLSARAAGEEYRMRVAPVDPIDPFRGAYVTLDYPDLSHDDTFSAGGGLGALEDGESGPVYVSLTEDDGLMRATEFSRSRPETGRYLACDDRNWQIRCGIESWFASQSEARRLGRELAEDGGVAVVRIDSRGNAALVALEPR